MNKNKILKEYFIFAVSADKYLYMLDAMVLTEVDIKEIEGRLNFYNNQLAKMEDKYPWIANVLIAMGLPNENNVKGGN